jgi:sporulation protein YlmC with PRC-barrel domain
MDAIQSSPGNMGTLRQCQRLYVGVEVSVGVQRGNEKLSPETTKTIMVSANGALVPLRMVVAVGDILTVRNLQTRQEVFCRVVDLEFNNESERTEVRIEFIEPAPRFWSVFFPPEGWNSRNGEAKGYVPRISAVLIPARSSIRPPGQLMGIGRRNKS